MSCTGIVPDVGGTNIERKVKIMRLIDIDALCVDLRMQWEQVFSKTKAEVRPEDFFIERLSAFQVASIHSDIEAFADYLNARPTVAAVPVSDLLALRDNLYETDRITMSGLYDLNMLIAKYAQGGKDSASD